MARLNVTFALIVCAAAAFTNPAWAAGAQTGTVSRIQINKDYAGGVITFTINGAAPSGKSACGTGDPNRWTLKTGDGNPLNDDYYATLLTAMTTGMSITVGGTGACTVVPWVEDVVTIDMAR